MKFFKFRSKVDKLVEKIVAGKFPTSKEELQLYVNNSEEIERRLKNISEEGCAER